MQRLKMPKDTEMINFGTDGIRGKANIFPFTPDALVRIGKAIANWSLEKYNKKNPNVLIGHDTRLSCPDVKNNLKIGLSSANIKITDGDILPTPAVLQLVKHKKNFDFGIVISASHNPYSDNGIKLFDATTGKITKEDELIICNYFSTLNDTNLWKDSGSEYIKNILSFFQPKFLKGKKIVLDCANGATHSVAPKIFESLGATVIAISTEPNGININEKCGALHPELAQKEVIIQKADAGFAFDGDGDRVIAISKTGKIKDGDDALTLLLQHPEFKNVKSVVGTIMTNHGFSILLKELGKKLIRTDVGDRYVAEKLAQENLIIGGEPSGHVIINTYLNSGDGIFTALKVLESITITNNWNMDTFDKTPQICINIPISKKDDLSRECYVKLLNEAEKKLLNGRVIVRYSGTENLLRVMVEDQTEESAKNAAQILGDKLKAAHQPA